MKKRRILIGVLSLGLFLILVMAWAARPGIHAAAQGNGPEAQGASSAQDPPQRNTDLGSQGRFEDGGVSSALPVQQTQPLDVGDFTLKASSPVALTSVASDPSTGYIYAQQDHGTGFYFYDPVADAWTPLTSSPLDSGNNGGAACLDGKIYTVYTGNGSQIGVYDIAADSWTTIPNGLGAGTGVIATDGQYLYLARGATFKRYYPAGGYWTDLITPTIDIQPWGGMDYWNGALYAHRGNGYVEFARYNIASNSWWTQSSLPDGAVLGSAIDPAGPVYYAYGNYGGDNWYAYDLQGGTWSTTTLPFTVSDGGMARVGRPDVSGIYFVQGENGAAFARMETELAPGDVLDSWDSTLSAAWGIAYTADDTVWVGEGWGSTNSIYEYLPNGAATGVSHTYNWLPTLGPADNAFNRNTDMVWTLDVGGDDCLHEMDPATGYTGNTICSSAWSVSQRGLAYDPKTDTWYVGGWNDRTIYHIDSSGALLDSANVGLSISGLAYNPETQHLFVQINGYTDEVYVLDADQPGVYPKIVQFHIGALTTGAGLAIDCEANLWAVDQNDETVYRAESGESANLCPDLTPPSGSFTVNNGEPYVNSTAVTLNIAVSDPETGVSDMRFREGAPWRALVLQDADPWGSDALQQVLATHNVPYDQFPSSAIAAINLEPYPLVVIPSDQPQGFYDIYDANRPKFETYVTAGGLVEFHAAAWGWNSGSLAGIPLPGGVGIAFSSSSYNYIEEPAHPLVAGVVNPIEGSSASHGYFTDTLPGALTICTEGDTAGGNPTLIEYPLGSGRVIATGQTLEIAWDWEWQGGAILDNMIPYIAGHTPWAAEIPWTLSSSDGVKTVYGEFRNGDGTWSLVYSDTITLDTSLPSSIVTASPDYDNAGGVPVDWSASDSLSGVASTSLWYKLETGGAWTHAGLTQSGDSGAFDFAPPGGTNGTYYFGTQATDNAANTEGAPGGSGDDSTVYDTALPIALANCAPETEETSFSTSWVGNDATSGIASYDVQYRVGTGGTWTAWQTSTTVISDTFGPTSPVTVEKGKTYYFRARAHDLAGNQGLYAPGDGDCSTFVSGAGWIYLPLVTREYDDYHAAPCGPDNNYCENYDGWQTAYGPLRFDTQYRAYPEDGSDYYYFELNSARNVTVEVQNYQATTGDLILYRHRTDNDPEYVANWGVGGATMRVTEALQVGKYYARVYTTDGFNTTALYTLIVTAD